MVKLCKFLDLSAGSQSKYSQQQEAFLEFCSCFGFDPFNLTEEELSMAAVHYAMGHTVHSVPGFMSAIQKLYDLSGNGPLPRGPVFHMALKGLRRQVSCFQRTRSFGLAPWSSTTFFGSSAHSTSRIQTRSASGPRRCSRSSSVFAPRTIPAGACAGVTSST